MRTIIPAPLDFQIGGFCDVVAIRVSVSIEAESAFYRAMPSRYHSFGCPCASR
jgi:hypothetical protein